jgi:quercetin dioxygenase-like cupin family protein
MNNQKEESYGQSLRDVNLRNRIVPNVFSWGNYSLCVNRPEFSLHKLDIQAKSIFSINKFDTDVTYFVRSGDLSFVLFEKDTITKIALGANGVLDLPVNTDHTIMADNNSEIFLFCPSSATLNYMELNDAGRDFESLLSDQKIILVPGKCTTDFRKKYWGSIETIVNGDIAGKKISIRAGMQSSLEYHVLKTEAYYVSKGKVKVGLRIGRAQNVSIDLEQGDVFQVLPGTMHMRMGIEDCEIIEISTRDFDSDSRLVEDGKIYTHIES